MECEIVSMSPFQVIGFQKLFEEETAYQEVPKFWDEVYGAYTQGIFAGKAPSNEYEQAFVDHNIGEYGVCIEDPGAGKFRYLIAGRYEGGAVPEGMVLYEIPGHEWAIFSCIGPLPEALQAMNTRIYQEWLPDNPDYELADNILVEWYDAMGDAKDPSYRSAIWIPIQRRAK